ncbi:MAG TPA: RNA polymerase sigma factor [Phycisphaerae bacterium]|nr:RNA polymerase sigma factor [Phycisphaerae bacterium]
MPEVRGPPETAGCELIQEQELLGQLALGDVRAIETIRAQFAGELQLFCRRMVYDVSLAEDIVQDVLMTCLDGNSTTPSRSLRGWLYKLARNRSIDNLRRMRPAERLSALKNSSHFFTDAAFPLDPATTPAGKAIKADRAQRVQLALDAMDDSLREVIILHFFQGLPREEVAEVIGMSLAGMKARLVKATRLLRRQLQSLDDSSL